MADPFKDNNSIIAQVRVLSINMAATSQTTPSSLFLLTHWGMSKLLQIQQCWWHGHESSRENNHIRRRTKLTWQLFRTTRPRELTHWGRVTHICVGKLTIIGSDNGLSWTAPSHFLNQCWNITNRIWWLYRSTLVGVIQTISSANWPLGSGKQEITHI